MGPRGDGAYRAGEAEGRSFGGDGDKTRITGDPGSQFLGDGKPELLLKKPDLGGDGGKAKPVLSVSSDGKKRRLTDEPGLAGDEFRAGKPALFSSAGHLFPSGELVDKKPRDAEAQPGGEGDKRHAPLFTDGEAETKAKKRRTESSHPEETSALPLPPPPALIAQAIEANGPPPLRQMHLTSGSDGDEKEDPVILALYCRGVEREDRYDPYADYFLLGRPQAAIWYKKWLDSPLDLHDAGLVTAVDSTIMWGPGMRTHYLDVSDYITRVLQKHPGPVSTLRVDASELPCEQQLNRWMWLLSAKQAKKVILINVTAPVEQTVVPLQHLSSRDLSYLGLGFLNICDTLGIALVSGRHNGHPWSTITELSLTACLFWGPHLALTVKDLWSLRILRFGHCELTQGCEEDMGLQIESPSLISLQFLSCTATKKLVLGRAPEMATLDLGLCSAFSRSTSSPPIHIHFCETLCELRGIALPYHDVRLWTNYPPKVRKPILSLPCLRVLVITVDMKSTSGVRALHSFLIKLPKLERLDLSCAHSGDGEEEKFPSVPGIAKWLKHLTVRQFAGDTREVAFIIHIIKTSRRLASVAVHPSATMPVCLKDTARFLKERPTASKHCRIRVGLVGPHLP